LVDVDLIESSLNWVAIVWIECLKCSSIWSKYFSNIGSNRARNNSISWSTWFSNSWL